MIYSPGQYVEKIVLHYAYIHIECVQEKDAQQVDLRKGERYRLLDIHSNDGDIRRKPKT